MKIIVCVKQVPDTSGKVAVNADGTLDRASMQTIINPDDMNAVEAALTLKDQLGCPVIAVSMGPPPAAGMLLELMAARPSTATPLRSARRSLRSWRSPRCPTWRTSRRTATPSPSSVCWRMAT